jgi:hypothetical protein
VIVPSFTDATAIDTVTFDVRRYRGARVELLARGRPIGQATIGSVAQPKREAECPAWPTAALSASAGAPLSSWSVGFVSGRVESIAMDSIETLPRADSARLAADVARMASSLPNDTAQSLRGLPFVVRTVRRFSPEPGVAVLFAEVIRRLAVEANPRHEQILLVAESDSASSAGYSPVYSERASGAEEAVETTDLLAVVRLGASRRITAVLAREYGEGGAYSLLERTAAGRWRVRWTSAYAGC